MSQGGAFGGLLRLASCQGKLTAQGGERAESTLRPAPCEDGQGGQGLKAGHRALSPRDLEPCQGPDSAGGGEQPLMSVQAAQPRRREECTPAAQLGAGEQAGLLSILRRLREQRVGSPGHREVLPQVPGEPSPSAPLELPRGEPGRGPCGGQALPGTDKGGRGAFIIRGAASIPLI